MGVRGQSASVPWWAVTTATASVQLLFVVGSRSTPSQRWFLPLCGWRFRPQVDSAPDLRLLPSSLKVDDDGAQLVPCGLGLMQSFSPEGLIQDLTRALSQGILSNLLFLPACLLEICSFLPLVSFQTLSVCMFTTVFVGLCSLSPAFLSVC